MNRREFLGTSLAAGVVLSGVHTFPVSRAAEKSANEKLNLACIGVGNKGWHNIENLKDQNIAVLCDVDSEFLGQAAKHFPKATQYRDYRKMLDREHKNIDAVVVSTADHSHAPATAAALSLSKHIYCEKPLTHTIAEARHIVALARKQKVATQLGTQIHGDDNYRRVVELVRSGAIGTVQEVYTWCNRPRTGGKFVKDDKPAPANLDWDLWLGPARQRPYSRGIHPKDWRGFWEYGGGTFGDMASHIMDLPFWALGLRHPTSIETEGPPVDPVSAPAWTLTRYEFPAHGDQPALKFYWSDGGKHFDLVQKTTDHKGKSLSTWGLGILFVGNKGMLAADYGHRQLLPKEKFASYDAPKQTIPNSIGHWNEWVKACKTGSPTTCNFDYAGPLTENLLLGIVSYRCGKKLEWDAKNLKATNTREADEFLTKQYRKGWEVAGLT